MNLFKRFVFITLFILPFTCFAESFTEGDSYTRLPQSVRANKLIEQLLAKDPNKVQVLFFFSYGCPACANFDPYFEKWLKTPEAKKVAIYQFPVSFEEDWAMLARLYYVTQNLTPKKDLDPQIFAAIHKEHLNLPDPDVMKNFLIKQGYKADAVDMAIKSYAVQEQAKHADQISEAYDVTRTPTIVINGHSASFMLTPDKIGGDMDKFINVINYVLSTQRK